MENSTEEEINAYWSKSSAHKLRDARHNDGSIAAPHQRD